MHTRLKRFLSSLLALSLAACQSTLPTKPNSPVSPNIRFGDAPNLINPSQPKLPEKLRQTILLRKGDPNLVKVDTFKNLQSKVFPDKIQALKSLNTHFGIAQSLPQVDCNGSVCSYERIGDFDAFYSAIYGDYSESYNNGLCAYDEFFYCTPDPDNPECAKQIYELKFYGCACPEGFSESPQGCYREPNLTIQYQDTEPPASPPSEWQFSLTDPDGVKDQLRFDILSDGQNTWSLKINDSQGQEVWSQSDSQAQDYGWQGHNNQGEILPNGLYTLHFQSGEVIKTAQIRIENAPLLVAHGNIPPGETPQGLVISPGNLDGRYDFLRLGVFPSGNHTWKLDLLDSQNQIVSHQEGTNGMGPIEWYGTSFEGGTLNDGIYTIRLTDGPHIYSQSVEIQVLEIKVLHANVPGDESAPPPGPVFISPANRDRRYDSAFFKVIAGNNQNWLLEVRDQGNSVVWYRRGQGLDAPLWSGTNQQDILLPEGTYKVRVVSGNIIKEDSVSITHEVNPPGVDVFMPLLAQQILDSADGRLPLLEKDVELLLEETREAFPNAPDFQIQSLPDIADFRIKQQQIELPPPDLSAYPEPQEDDFSKTQLDEQNDRIVREILVLQQKLNWVEQTHQNFGIQQVTGGSGRLNRLANLRRSSSGITFTSGCYDYYQFKGSWKKKKNKAFSVSLLSAFIQPDRTIKLTGRVNNPPEGFDFNSLVPDFEGNLDVSGITVTPNGTYFTMLINNFTYTPAYLQNNMSPESEVIELKAKVKSCTSECIISNIKNLDSMLIEAKREAEVIFSPLSSIDFTTLAYSGSPNDFKSPWREEYISFGPGKQNAINFKAIASYRKIINNTPLLIDINSIVSANHRLSVYNREGKEVYTKPIYGTSLTNPDEVTKFTSSAQNPDGYAKFELFFRWNGLLNNGQYVPTGKEYQIEIAYGVILLNNGVTSNLINSQINKKDTFNIVSCPNDDLTRFAESNLIQSNGKPGTGKHGPNWSDADAISRSILEKGTPQGRFGSIETIQKVVNKSKEVCPGAEYWFEMPSESHKEPKEKSVVIFQNGDKLFPTHYFVKVYPDKTPSKGYKIHAFPGINPTTFKQ
jgi:flagellar hook assembly protein FlgD